MIADLHRVFVPFHRNSSSFGIQCLVKIYEFADKKEEQRILASMSRTRDSVLQFRPVITSSLFFSTCSVSSTAKCWNWICFQPHFNVINTNASKCSCFSVMFSVHFIMDWSISFMGTIKQIWYFDFIYEHVVCFIYEHCGQRFLSIVQQPSQGALLAASGQGSSHCCILIP